MRIQSKRSLTVVLPLVLALAAGAQESGDGASSAIETATASLEAELQASIAELARLRDEMAAEQVPLSRRLSELEAELSTARLDYQEASRLLETRTLDLGSLRTRIQGQEEESLYLSNLLGDYMRELDAGLHIAERARYEELLQAAQLAVENASLTDREIVAKLIELLPASLERLEDALGGSRFEGAALDAEGLLEQGRFALFGPVALFRSADGRLVGTVEQRVNSLEPTVYEFGRPEDAHAAAAVVADGAGLLPLDPTLGSARKIESTSETVWEHIQAGGPVMAPILLLAGLALLVAIAKWLHLSFVRKPSSRQLAPLFEAVRQRDEEAVRERVQRIRGPMGRMLKAGVEHLSEPRELIEEVMYERVLTTRLSLQRMLPFVGISAAAAPLLGLLGTVTGIINTFKMITVFGSGDVKSLSGGISEALITTEYGLYVAIPSLLLHAFLTRKARSIVSAMESTAIAFANEVESARFEGGNGAFRAPQPAAQPALDPDLVREQVDHAIEELLEARVAARLGGKRAAHDVQGAVLVPQPAKRD